METQAFSFADIIPIIKKRFKILVLVGAVAGILASIFSGPSFIKPRYTSTAIYYPSNLSPYSKETRTEQLLQLFESTDIRKKLVSKFDLYTKYEIDSGAPSSKFYMNAMLNERISINKTKYESVEITIQDEDPQVAFDMVNEMRNQLNLKARELQREKSYEIVNMRKREVQEHQAHIDSLINKMVSLGKEYGVIEYEAQAAQVIEGYFDLLASGKSENSSSVKEAKMMLEGLKTKGPEFKYLYEVLEFSSEEFGEMILDYQRSLNDIKKELTYLNEVVSPEVADKKSYPIRWIILFTAVFSSVLFTLVALLLFDRKTVA